MQIQEFSFNTGMFYQSDSYACMGTMLYTKKQTPKGLQSSQTKRKTRYRNVITGCFAGRKRHREIFQFILAIQQKMSGEAGC